MNDDTRRSQRRLTGKREMYAQKVAEGATLSDAYRAAFDTSKMQDNTISARASELAKVPAIADRIGYLQGVATAAAVERISYTLADAMAQADTAFEAAEGFEQAGAMVSAATLKAKLAGFLIDRKEVRAGPLEEADVAELLALKADLEARQAREEAADELAGEMPSAAPPPAEGNRPTSRRTLQ